MVMVKQQLNLLGYKYGICVAMAVFFLICFLGYISDVSIDTLIKKAIIAGCILGLAFFVAIKLLSSLLPENIDLMIKENDSNAPKTDK